MSGLYSPTDPTKPDDPKADFKSKVDFSVKPIFFASSDSVSFSKSVQMFPLS